MTAWPNRLVSTAFIAIILGLVGVIAYRVTHAAPVRGAALAILPELLPPECIPTAKLVLAAYEEYRANAIRWSGVYFGCVFGSALFSALAGLTLKLDILSSRPEIRSDVAASFAMIGALLVTLSTVGDFQRKWRANRVAAAGMESLAFDIVKVSAPFDRDKVIAQMQAINAARTDSIVGPDKPSHSDK